MNSYPPLIQQFIEDFQQKKWAAQPYERAMNLLESHPEMLVSFINAVVTELPQGGTYHDAVFSFLPLEDFPQIVDHALSEFARNNQNEAAEAVISYCSLQCLSALHPHLAAIFILGINEKSYYAEWPWREAGKDTLDFLRPIIEDMEQSEATRIRAWEAVLETRAPILLEYAYGVSRTLPLPSDPALYFREVGYELILGQPQALYPDATYHLQFPARYIDDSSRTAWLRVTSHPTWNLAGPTFGPFPFGGEVAETDSTDTACPFCGGILHHLITLETIPNGLGVKGLSVLTLAVCLSCLGWEQESLFYHHDVDGHFQAIGNAPVRVTPQFPAAAFVPTMVRLVETPARWRWQSCGSSNGRENLHRVGGFPCWIQSAEHPTCPKCSTTMHFLMQLDSELPTADGNGWLWGSGGIGYVFWCDGCKISGMLWQCT
ncbi:MAG: hypothetical protein ACRYFS_25275 [Janthinobacterium lividum]